MAKTNENTAVKVATIPRRTSKFETKYKMMIEETGNKQASTVPRMWTTAFKHESEYWDISESGSSGSVL
jgi:hypothetical protein